MGKPGSFVSYGLPWANVSSTHLKGQKMLATEGGIRVPMIVRWPERFAGGKAIQTFTSVMDITPTLLELAGIQHPGTSYRGRDICSLDGSSLVPLLKGDTRTVRRNGSPVGYELFGHRVLFDGDWKLLKQQAPYGKGSWELYNTVDDPSENTDLSDVYPQRVQQMEKRFEEYLVDNGVILPPAEFNAANLQLGIRDLLDVVFSD